MSPAEGTESSPVGNAARLFGAHMGTTGGLHNAFGNASAVGCEVIQIFTKSPQQWKARELTDEQVEAFCRAREESGIPCLASHDTYLINPAAADPALLEKSRAALVDEMVRSSRLGIPFVVMHLGATVGAPEDEAIGFRRFGVEGVALGVKGLQRFQG